jgi:hypothetical protein
VPKKEKSRLAVSDIFPRLDSTSAPIGLGYAMTEEVPAPPKRASAESGNASDTSTLEIATPKTSTAIGSQANGYTGYSLNTTHRDEFRQPPRLLAAFQGDSPDINKQGFGHLTRSGEDTAIPDVSPGELLPQVTINIELIRRRTTIFTSHDWSTRTHCYTWRS